MRSRRSPAGARRQASWRCARPAAAASRRPCCAAARNAVQCRLDRRIHTRARVRLPQLPPATSCRSSAACLARRASRRSPGDRDAWRRPGRGSARRRGPAPGCHTTARAMRCRARRCADHHARRPRAPLPAAHATSAKGSGKRRSVSSSMPTMTMFSTAGLGATARTTRCVKSRAAPSRRSRNGVECSRASTAGRHRT